MNKDRRGMLDFDFKSNSSKEEPTGGDSVEEINEGLSKIENGISREER